MKPLVDIAQMLVGDVRIDLGGADITVAEHALNTPNIGAVHQQVSRETMPHGVRANVFGDTSTSSIARDYSLDAAWRQTAKITRGISDLLVAAIAQK